MKTIRVGDDLELGPVVGFSVKPTGKGGTRGVYGLRLRIDVLCNEETVAHFVCFFAEMVAKKKALEKLADTDCGGKEEE